MNRAACSRALGRLRAAGFTLVEVVGTVAIVSVALVGLRALVVGTETRAAQARAEATVGRRLRLWQNVVTSCPYDLLPAAGVLEEGFGYEPWDPAAQTYLQSLPFTVTLARNVIDETRPTERSELTVSIAYRVVAPPGQATNAPPGLTRTGSLVVRYPGQAY